MGEPVTPYKGRDAQAIISQALVLYDGGKEIEEIEKEVGVPARTLYRWLANNASDQWQEAQKGRAVADYETARKRRDKASSTLNQLKVDLDQEGVKDAAERNWRLAHAREVLRAADTELDHQKWLLERLLKRIYGQEQAAGSGQLVQINIGIKREPLDVVGESEVSSAHVSK